MGVAKTLLGVDLFHGAELVGKDLNEEQFLVATAGRRVQIVVTVIGGQVPFGRGTSNSVPRDSRRRKKVIVVATVDKLHGLGGPLLVDTGDSECDSLLAGYIRVITGPREGVVWRVTA